MNTYLIYCIGTKVDTKDGEFCHCCCQIFNLAITHILWSLKPFVTESEVVWCPNGHFCHVMYSLGPYIGGYLEQCLLSCIVQGLCIKLALVI